MSKSESTTWHICKEPIKHNGELYKIGSRIELNDDCRQRLNDSGAIDNAEAPDEKKPADENHDGDNKVVQLNAGGQGDKTPTPAEEPTLPEARQAVIIKAIAQLDKDNDAHWLKDKVTPELKVINDILKWNTQVSKSERDAAMVTLSNEQ